MPTSVNLFGYDYIPNFLKTMKTNEKFIVGAETVGVDLPIIDPSAT